MNLMRTLFTLALVLLLPLSVAAAEANDYDPIATLLPVDEHWTDARGAFRVLHALVTVPGPGTYDVELQVPATRCPPQSALKRKLPGEDHVLIAIEAALMSLGWHPEDGFTRLRFISWGLVPRTYHVALYYCP